ncbi:MAG: hypothetical protein OSA99_19720 [Acidimicrobiales bacterium]|nr:hypothetical protein [Acidimicrobiales bacterium]
MVLLVLATASSLTGFWAHGTIVDEGGWNDAMGDLLDDDAVADEVASIITDRTVDAVLDAAIDIPFVSGAVEDLAAGPVRDAVRPAVVAIVRSEIASAAWAAAVASAHDDAVAVLRGDSTALVDGPRIRLDLSSLADRIADRVDDALGPIAAIGPLGSIDVDLEIVLHDLSEHDTSLDVASFAERQRWPLLFTAVAAALVLIATTSNRGAALTAVGALVVLSALGFRLGLGASEPDGLATTWASIVATADTATWSVIGVGAVFLLAGASWWLALRTRRRTT